MTYDYSDPCSPREEAPRTLTIERLGDGGYIVTAGGPPLLATATIEKALLYMANKMDPNLLHRDLNDLITEYAKAY